MDDKKSKEIKVYVSELAAFAQDTENANDGTARGNAVIEMSLRECGAGRSLLADADNRLIGGNKTHRQAEYAGIKEAIVVETDGSRLVVVKRTDLDLENDPKARQLAYLDNRAQELNLAWNPNQVAADVAAGMDLSLMFYDDELDQIIGDVLDEEEQEAESGKDVFPEMELQPFEHYDYMVLVFRSTFDWSKALDLFELDKAGFTVSRGKRKIGLCRVIDGRKVLEKCGLSFQAESE